MRGVPSGKRNSFVWKKCAGLAATLAYRLFQKSFILSSGGPMRAWERCAIHGHNKATVRAPKKSATPRNRTNERRSRDGVSAVPEVARNRPKPDTGRSRVRSVMKGCRPESGLCRPNRLTGRCRDQEAIVTPQRQSIDWRLSGPHWKLHLAKPYSRGLSPDLRCFRHTVAGRPVAARFRNAKAYTCNCIARVHG